MMRNRAAVATLGILTSPLVLLACARLDSSVTDLEVGDCVLQPAEGALGRLKHVECGGLGTLRVVSVFDIEGYDDFPGEATIKSEASSRCPTSTVFTLTPTRDTWNEAGGRQIACFERPVPTDG